MSTVLSICTVPSDRRKVDSVTTLQRTARTARSATVLIHDMLTLYHNYINTKPPATLIGYRGLFLICVGRSNR